MRNKLFLHSFTDHPHSQQISSTYYLPVIVRGIGNVKDNCETNNQILKHKRRDHWTTVIPVLWRTCYHCIKVAPGEIGVLVKDTGQTPQYTPGKVLQTVANCVTISFLLLVNGLYFINSYIQWVTFTWRKIEIVGPMFRTAGTRRSVFQPSCIFCMCGLVF